jgi:hypothetical protein
MNMLHLLQLQTNFYFLPSHTYSESHLPVTYNADRSSSFLIKSSTSKKLPKISEMLTVYKHLYDQMVFMFVAH